jgi:hypothetical protein
MTDVTKPQLQYLAMLRRDSGYPADDAGRGDWFRWVHTNIGRLVTSNTQLTKAEASVLIDVLIHQDA